eukprot:s1338_g8.t1
MKYAGSLEAIFMDLRAGPRPGVSNLWKEIHYTILDVDVESGQLHLDQPVQQRGDSIWFYDQHMLNVLSVSADLCTVSSADHLVVGDEVTQRIFLTDVNDVLTAFEEYWTPRWSMLAQIPTDQWQRIVGFASHYMPQYQFVCPDLDLASWRSIVKKFKPSAARGPDGFSKDDLKMMPPEYVRPLLELLSSVEHGTTPWPKQLAFGTVIGLSKCDGAHEEGQYRPITLFPIIYRAWSRLRTRQMIMQLSKYMPPEALGFLPHTERPQRCG